jgi:non-ribosomal peptide synthetase component F
MNNREARIHPLAIGVVLEPRTDHHIDVTAAIDPFQVAVIVGIEPTRLARLGIAAVVDHDWPLALAGRDDPAPLLFGIADVFLAGIAVLQETTVPANRLAFVAFLQNAGNHPLK